MKQLRDLAISLGNVRRPYSGVALNANLEKAKVVVSRGITNDGLSTKFTKMRSST